MTTPIYCEKNLDPSQNLLIGYPPPKQIADIAPPHTHKKIPLSPLEVYGTFPNSKSVVIY